ncbi:dihydroorotate dehydrogenase-like protein [Anaeromyxobacter oryzae]|uniref:Dihydroorotate dehydrogenase n=1 Tax=Anaeromyxobacter oryzae TaxID=2918170 RepID=A0ABM7WY21_9BACT|nr:dihydroorotate dehydrogenase-like protein [Anaeromyxobacter oryzae]BDG04430.1 dihydroorotate dehydrogenase [Anaeromyxobacter oryzae]
MAELVTEYMGLALPSPLVLASSAFSNRVENLEMAEGHGAGAVVLRSLFEELIEAASTALEEELARGAESNPEARTYFPPQRVGPHEYLSLVERAKRALEVPVIASLNCCAPGSWTEYAREIEQAGADAIEVNLYAVEADPRVSSAEIEQRYLDIVEAVRDAVHVPIAVKLSPYFTSLAHFAARLDALGVNAVVLFNRFLQPDISLEKMAAVPSMTLSTPAEMLVSLRWIGILHGRVRAHLAASTGVYDAPGVLKQILAGAQVVQVASTLVKNGIPHMGKILAGVEDWLDRKGTTLDAIRGTLSQRELQDPGAFERAQYVHLILSQNI